MHTSRLTQILTGPECLDIQFRFFGCNCLIALAYQSRYIFLLHGPWTLPSQSVYAKAFLSFWAIHMPFSKKYILWSVTLMLLIGKLCVSILKMRFTPQYGLWALLSIYRLDLGSVKAGLGIAKKHYMMFNACLITEHIRG